MTVPALVGDLRIDGRGDQPLGVDDRCPSLSWRMTRGIRQSAYRIVVSDGESGNHLWDTGKVGSDRQRVAYDGLPLVSRQRVVWQVRVWDGQSASPWSAPSSWEMGLLHSGDWGAAWWIEHPSRTAGDPLPLFARAFAVASPVNAARLYVCGIGLHEATVNGRAVTDEVLAPGNSNYQRSVEYRTYDVTGLLRDGANVIGVRLGNGTADVHREGTHPARPSAYSWWTSQPTGIGTLRAPAAAGATSVRVSSVEGYHLGGTLNIGRGASLECRRITAVGTAGVDGAGIAVEPALDREHENATVVSGSGNPVADVDPSAGAAVTPRMIARLELVDAEGNVELVTSGPGWRTALGPAVTDNWFSGTDYDARREQVGWDEPGADLSESATRRDGSPTGWVDACLAPPPNLTTELVWRAAPPVRVVRCWDPAAVTRPRADTRVFDFEQNLAGWPELWIEPGLAPGVTVTMRPAEALRADGTVDQDSIRNPDRGTDVLHTYTTWGAPGGECWRPSFQYFGMRYLQVTGLPAGCRPRVRVLQLRADITPAGDVVTSNERINRIHRMAHYSVASNAMSVLTDCPGREKLAYGADYTHPMGVLSRHFDFSAYLLTMQRHLAEGQSCHGNVALKTPVYDWGYTGKFGDEINWGNAIIRVPWILYELYGDTETMARYYQPMRDFLRYITECKAGSGDDAHIVTGPLGDWVAAEETAGELTGTWGYFRSADLLGRMASVLGYDRDAQSYGGLADDIASAFHARFFDSDLRCYTGDGTAGGATQAAQALALDAGLVPAQRRAQVLDALVERIYAYHPSGGGPHFSAGHIGLGPLVRALEQGDRDEVLWEVIQEDTPPSYGHFLRSTPENPGGLTTVPEQWDLRNSLNHMILAQVDEWFHNGLAGIRQGPGSVGYRNPVVKPKIVGDLRHVEGCYEAPAGRIASRWDRNAESFTLTVDIPPNTRAEVWVPGAAVREPAEAILDRVEGKYRVYSVNPGTHTFTTALSTPQS